MAAEVAIACGDAAEAQLACAAVTQAVDDSGGGDDLTLLDQVCLGDSHEALSNKAKWRGKHTTKTSSPVVQRYVGVVARTVIFLRAPHF